MDKHKELIFPSKTGYNEIEIEYSEIKCIPLNVPVYVFKQIHMK